MRQADAPDASRCLLRAIHQHLIFGEKPLDVRADARAIGRLSATVAARGVVDVRDQQLIESEGERVGVH